MSQTPATGAQEAEKHSTGRPGSGKRPQDSGAEALHAFKGKLFLKCDNQEHSSLPNALQMEGVCSQAILYTQVSHLQGLGL